MADKPFQRKGAKSNAHVGKEFERKAQEFFAGKRLQLVPGLSVSVGINRIKKPHRFDLGNKEKKIIVECKSHTWTEGGNVPSAKMISWNEAMYLFVATPASYRKILFVLRDYSPKRKETLAQYYIRTHSHLIPKGAEIWEYDEEVNNAKRLR